MRWPWSKQTPAARRKRKKAEEARRKAERERIFDNGVWWAGFLGWHLATGIWIALLLVVLFIEFWIGIARGFYDQGKMLKQAWSEREKEKEDKQENGALGTVPSPSPVRKAGGTPNFAKLDPVTGETEGHKQERPAKHAKLYLLPPPVK